MASHYYTYMYALYRALSHSCRSVRLQVKIFCPTCSGVVTGAIAPVPIFQGGAPLQFLFLLFLVIFALILQKLKLDLVNYLVTCMLCIKSCTSHVNVCKDTSIVRMALVLILNLWNRWAYIYSRTVSHDYE